MSLPAWKSCAGICLLVVLCGVLAVLQYNWIGEVADAERSRLKDDLQSRLYQVRRSFDDQMQAACNRYIPPDADIDRLGRKQAYVDQYRRAIGTPEALIRREALAIPSGDDVDLLILDPKEYRFESAEWPADWSAMHARLGARLRGGPIPSGESATTTLVEIPRFGNSPGDQGRQREQEWLLLELDTDALKNTILPAVLAGNLGDAGRLDYDARVVLNGDPAVTLYRSGGGGAAPFVADATVGLLDVGGAGPRGDGRGRGRGRGPGPPPGERRDDKGGRGAGASSRGNPTDGAWLLSVHHRAGSLEALAATTRRKNLTISAGILLLILATAAMLLRASRETQRVAELQMNFVAGVSHELRTPLTVIRTAAFNLRRNLSANPEQVERYGELIQKESEKLGTLVEQVLRYGSAKAGSVIQQRQPVDVEAVIESSLRASRVRLAGMAFVIDKRIDPELPPILADEEALKHALQNLLDNAARHGAEGRWIGIFAAPAAGTPGPMVEIRIADRGPGIPADELSHIFDPFFRGRRALADQVHGTGLGLNLAKRIVEAHGGSIEVKSEPSQVKNEPAQGTEFIVRLPAGNPS
ncbi:MAG TPA: HAMP domain-containing sensor histidine kinase [Bryobacteraceae bacterium]|jgi:signal transduction histidine kinase